MPPPSGYLLDTNILLQLLRGNPIGQFVDRKYGLRSNLSNCVISVVTVGEMESLSRKFAWGAGRLAALKVMLNEVPWVDIDDVALLEIYGEIDHYSNNSGRPMGKNDVWIAATAHVTKLTLLTTDLDFDHLHGTYLSRIWIDPKTPTP